MSSNQLTLDGLENDLPGYRRADLPTARKAALDVAPRAETQRARVFDELKNAGIFGRTDYELSQALGLLRTSTGKRRLELQEQGLVQNSGRRRPTDTGSMAVVWTLTAEARRADA